MLPTPLLTLDLTGPDLLDSLKSSLEGEDHPKRAKTSDPRPHHPFDLMTFFIRELIDCLPSPFDDYDNLAKIITHETGIMVKPQDLEHAYEHRIEDVSIGGLAGIQCFLGVIDNGINSLEDDGKPARRFIEQMSVFKFEQRAKPIPIVEGRTVSDDELPSFGHKK
ncbi:hypothetical protein SAMN05660443_0800 [Marinospirillum celere]|uniref:Uncharacterized protein n=1 Tax=Marinospirillum celere TaxID=1122252 RepID=A0A1I1ERC2_9GAMM|nr:hypothetical protein [Marinospirillum celere]SFB89729.1 hypothetical protein SAMN05660443_0800 [Marinospirillum celere]